MSKQMDILVNNSPEHQAELGRILIAKAYKEHRWQTQNRKQVAIEEFGNWAARACYARVR